MNVSINSGRTFCASRFYSILLILILTLVGVSAKADLYTTIKNGDWTNQYAWSDGMVAPKNINNHDSAFVKNIITAQDLKINNGGTVIVYKQLNVDQITLNGPNSLLIVEEGGILNANSIKGNYENIIYKYTQPLPVTLIQFTAKAHTAGSNLLTWKTATEKDNNFFAIESSTDGKVFNEVGKVTGKNTTSVTNYEFEDKAPANTKTYYRLKQVDFDGTATFSPVITCKSERKSIQLAGREISFDQAFSGQVRLLDLNGREVYNQSITNQETHRFPVENKGIFILLLQSAGQVTSQRIAL